MTAIDDVLRRVADLDAKATRGPWSIHLLANMLWKSQIATYGYGIIVGPGSLSPKYDHVPDQPEVAANAALHAEARTLLPQIAEMVRVAREGLERCLCNETQTVRDNAQDVLTAMEKAAESTR